MLCLTDYDLSKDILHIDTRMQENPSEASCGINPKTAWWLQHKNDPSMVACMKEARRKYYYKNQEREQQRGREYYYKRKAQAAAEAQAKATEARESPA